jgi:glycosyltransferase involved in cell wall biosynthesis
MACGSLLLSYGNEGSDEILRDGENGFLIPEGDILTAANRISTLLAEPERVESLVHRARIEIENDYSMDIYISKIEAFLFESTPA